MLTDAQESFNRLQNLSVADVMSRNVTVIPESATMTEAAEILATRGASGAPVVELYGRCIGVLSAADFMRFDKDDVVCSRAVQGQDDDARLWDLPWNSVQRYMTTPVHTVSPVASLMQAAELMCAQHIHRLIVLDDREAPAGLVSTLDVVSALMHASDEDRRVERHMKQRNGE